MAHGTKGITDGANGGLSVFENTEFGRIRTIVLDGKPWFVGKDVAEILGYSNSRKAIADHVSDADKGVTKCDTLGGAQELTAINESGVYLRSTSMWTTATRIASRFATEFLDSEEGERQNEDH